MLPLPDLLSPAPHLGIDRHALEEILGMAAFGRQVGNELDAVLADPELVGKSFKAEFFAGDLFLKDLVGGLTLRLGDRDYPLNKKFLARVLGHVPVDQETTHFRQAVLRELDSNDSLLRASEALYGGLFDLVALHKTPSYQANIDVAAFHLDILRHAQKVIDYMAVAFEGAESGLLRLSESGKAIQATEEYKTLAGLLEYDKKLANLELDISIGADGKIRNLNVKKLQENTKNRFYQGPLRRFLDRCKLAFNGYPMSNRELLNRMINKIYRSISIHFIPMLQLLGHLEVYLTARALREKARAVGLEMALPELVSSPSAPPIAIEGLFNPLLLTTKGHEPPVSSRLRLSKRHPITIITGPNSGGKTRLLQAIGLTQVLGQSGLYAPCESATLPYQNGLFVSLVEDESASQTEGRLGRELVRIRSLFEEMSPGSMVILDELCSGTNPSEGIEVFEMVLELLSSIDPTAFVTTHFLEFARSLETGRLKGEFEFRQVEIDADQRSTYQFLPGVAETSLASVTAERLGVTFDRLSQLIRDRAPQEAPESPARPPAPRSELADG